MDFVAIAGVGADFTAVTKISVELGPESGLENQPTNLDMKALTTLTATMSVELLDQDANNEVNPGDQLRYTVMAMNAGSDDTFDTVVTVFMDQAVTLINGSVTTDNGTVTVGNTGGDSYVSVNVPYVGALPCSVNSCSITLNTEIKLPYNGYNSNLCLQGSVTSSNAPRRTRMTPTRCRSAIILA